MKKKLQKAVIAAAVTAGSIECWNQYVNEKADRKRILKDEEGETFSTKIGDIFYTKRGEGSPVLLVHELNPISSSYEWCRIVKKLAKSHTVYAIDLLGCGRSDKPFMTYTSYLYVQIITDFIKEVIGEPPVIVTSSNSAAFAILAENVEGGLVKKIIAINPPAPRSMHSSIKKKEYVQKTLLQIPIIGSFIYNRKTNEINIAKTLQNRYFSNPRLISSKMLDAYYESAHTKGSRGRYLLASITGHYMDNQIAHAIEKIDVPFYIVESTELTNAESVIDTYTKINSSIETTSISNAKLTPQLEVPEKLINILNMLMEG